MSSQRWTVSQAAQALGVSEKTIYRRIKSGQLKASLHGSPPTIHWMIEPVVNIGQLSRQEDQGITSQEPTAITEILREQLQEKDRQIAELHVLLREAQGQIKTLLPAPRGEEQIPMRKRRRWWPF